MAFICNIVKKPLPLVLVLLEIILMSSCSKDRNKYWLTGTVELVSETGDTLLPGLFFIRYRESEKLYNDTAFDWMNLGYHKEGVVEIEEKFTRDIHSVEVYAKTDAFYYALQDGWSYWDYFMGEPMSMTKHSKRTLYARPVYHLNVKLNSTGCFDNSDTLWLNWTDEQSNQIVEHIYTGCYSNYTPPELPTIYSDQFWLQGTVKRNGVTTGPIEQFYDLQDGIINDVIFDY